MFVGHFAAGFLAKPAAPKTSLGTLMLASSLPDLLAFLFLVTGLEHFSVQPGITSASALNFYDIPLSHSLLMDVIWGALLAAAYFWRRYSQGAWLVFVLVVSHWLLDFVSHRPDISLAPGMQQYYGLGLYYSVRATLLVEGLIWFAGVIVYALVVRAHDRAGFYAFWGMIALLTVLWASGLAGPPPPNAATVEIANLVILAAVVAWAYWIDRVRTSNTPLERHRHGV